LSDLYLPKFLDIPAKLFFPWRYFFFVVQSSSR